MDIVVVRITGSYRINERCEAVEMVMSTCHIAWGAYEQEGEFILLVFPKHTRAFRNFNSEVAIREDSVLLYY